MNIGVTPSIYRQDKTLIDLSTVTCQLARQLTPFQARHIVWITGILE